MGADLPTPQSRGCGQKIFSLLTPLVRYHSAQSQPKEATSHA
jgi:hypothetical protein